MKAIFEMILAGYLLLSVFYFHIDNKSSEKWWETASCEQEKIGHFDPH